MTSEHRVLILFEGKTDKRLFERMVSESTFSSLLSEGRYQPTLLQTSIYELYDPLIKEEHQFDSLTTYLLHKGLISCPENTRPQDLFSLIYLVFDFDPRYHLYDPNIIRKLATYFSDETRKGLLYLNFPMVECLFDVKQTQDGLQVTKERPLSLCSSDSYKALVKKETPFRSPSGHPFTVLGKADFAKVGVASQKRYREIVGGSEEWSFSDLSGLLNQEIEAVDQEIVLPLSCLPFMALDYNAEETIKEWEDSIKNSTAND